MSELPHNQKGDGGRPAGEPVLAAGVVIDHFKVIRLLGRGGMGEVYLGRDLQLGRKVALKLIRAGQLGSPQAIAQFVTEARTTAKFSHPNIVAIHAAGTYRGSPYIALEYLPGQDLQQRLAQERLGLQEALRLALAIAEALAEAHRHGVLHRDLKPANVVIAQDGRPRVLDFGLATRADDTAGGSPVGTPAYMAPEQWTGEQCSEATDMWAFGIIAYELCSGRHPFRDLVVGADEAEITARWRQLVCGGAAELPVRIEEHAEVPEQIAELVSGCLQRQPAARPAAQDAVAVLSALIHRGRQPADANPYRGLLPFGEEHADLFFGREDEIVAFCERERLQPVLPVVGPSGAGKSSFVRAGVIPRLRERGRLLVLVVRPGSEPFRVLGERLLRAGQEAHSGDSRMWRRPATLPRYTRPVSEAVDEGGAGAADADGVPESAPAPSHVEREVITAELADKLREQPRELAFRLRALAEQVGHRVLLFIDQLEELFALVADGEIRRRYLEAICTAADDAADPVRVIFTVRDDYLGRLATGPRPREVLAHVTVVQSFDGEMLERILLKPARVAGYRFDDPELPRRMVEPLSDEPAGLPLLQFAAHALWERRDQEKKLLLSAAYERMGGVEGALARHADSVLDGLPAEERRTARALLLRLVSESRTRRPLARSQALEGLSDDAEQVLDRLISARLIAVTKGAEGDGRESMLELAHESLIHSWHTLSHWVNESAEELVFLAEVGRAAELWDKRGRRPSELWTGDGLLEARRMAKRLSSEPGELVTAFLVAGAERAQRAVRRRRAAVGAVIGLLATLGAAAIVVALVIADKEREANRQRQLALEQQKLGEQQRAAALREGARAAFGQGAVLEARAKLREAFEIRDSVPARGLWWQIEQQPLLWRFSLGSMAYAAAYSPTGRTVAVASHDGSIYLLDAVTERPLLLRGHEDQVLSAAYSPDGSQLASGSWNGDIRLWDLATRREVARLSGHSGGVWGLSFSPDGTRLVSGSEDGTVRIWSLKKDKQATAVLKGHDGSVLALAVSADGQRIASGGSDRLVRVWRLADGQLEQSFEGHQMGVRALSFTADGRRLASSGSDRTVRIWDLAQRKEVQVLGGHDSTILSLAFSSAGPLATGSVAGKVQLWDAATGRQLRLLGEHGAPVRGVAFDPPGRLLVAAGYDAAVKLYDTGVSAGPAALSGHTSATNGVAFAPDGKLLVSCSYDRTLIVWDTELGQPLRVLRGHEGAVESVAFAPDGQLLASGSADHSVRLWNPHSGTELQQLHGHHGAVRGLGFSPNSRQLSSASVDGTLLLWDLPAGSPRSLATGVGAFYSVSFSPDGKLLAAANQDNLLHLWDLATLTEVPPLRGHERGVYGVAFSPDGTTIATSSLDQSIRLWPAGGDGRHSRLLGRHEDRAYGIDYSPAGDLIASTSADRTARIWRVSTGEHVTLTGHRSEVNRTAFHPGGKLVATASDDGTVRLWEAASGRPFWRAPLLLSAPARLYTHRGWERLGADGQAVALPRARWVQAVEQQAQSAVARGDVLCLRSYDGAVERWSLSADQRTARHELKEPADVVVTADGRCIALGGGKAWQIGAAGEPVALPVEGTAQAVAAPGDEVLVASDREAVRFSGTTAVLRRPVDVGVTAVGSTAEGLVVGYRDGNLELLPAAGGEGRTAFEGVPASPPARLVRGPQSTLIAGYHNGFVGIWSLESGTRLAQGQLHGAVTHLLIEDQKLYAASDLGLHLTWDLAVMYRDYCALLEDIHRRVPVLWRDGAARLSPPGEHRCRPPPQPLPTKNQ